MNQITWTTRAVRQFRKLPTETQRTLGAGVGTLVDWPAVQNVKKLTGRSDYRLRVGDFRILFTVHPGMPVTIIKIEEVKKRDEHTC